MSRPDSPVVMSVILELRHFQVLVVQEGRTRWVATVHERTSAHRQTGLLNSIETSEGLATTLHLALDQILDTMGLAGRAEPIPPQTPTPPKAPWRRLN